jgi:hypothetical protein
VQLSHHSLWMLLEPLQEMDLHLHKSHVKSNYLTGNITSLQAV